MFVIYVVLATQISRLKQNIPEYLYNFEMGLLFSKSQQLLNLILCL